MNESGVVLLSFCALIICLSIMNRILKSVMYTNTPGNIMTVAI